MSVPSSSGPLPPLDGTLPDVAALAPTGLALLDAEGTILWANERLARTLRREPEELLELGLADLVHPDDGDLVTLDHGFVAWTRDPPRIRLARPDGRYVWVGIWLKLVEGTDGFHAVAHIADLTDLVRAEERIASLVDGLDDGLVVLDADGCVVTANPAARRMFSELIPNLIGSHLRDAPVDVLDDLGHPLPVHERPEIVALEAGASQRQLIGFRTADHDDRWVSVDAHPIERSQGVRWVAASYKDVSERRRIEAALATAEAADRAKGEFLSRMSHELRTPLNSVLGFAQLLHMSELGGRDREAVEQILIAGRHLLGLLDDVLDLERIDAGRLEVRVEPVALAPALREAVELVQPLAASHNITVDLRPGVDGARVLADAQRLRQVLLNLLTNAIKYNRPNGSVIVASRSEANRIVLRVTDTGPGLRPDEIARLFVPFERLEADRSGIEGAGVGLALAKRLTEAMGGEIGIESERGVGSTFWCAFAREPAGATTSETSQRAGDDGAQRSGPPHHRVLYIEDNAANRLLAEHIAEIDGRFELATAVDAQSGIDQALAAPPDAILLDLQLPDHPGEYVLSELQASPTTREIPVVIVSADASPERQSHLLDAGARAYLTKPLDIPAVFRTLDDVLAPPS
jgi:PAS domain S-box-containing protein